MYFYIYIFLFSCTYVVFCVFGFILLFCILSLCKFELYFCHRVSTKLQLPNISYHVISNPDKRHINYRPSNYVTSNSALYFVSIYHIKNLINKQWILWTHLMIHMSAVTELIFPWGCAYVVLGHTKSLSM